MLSRFNLTFPVSKESRSPSDTVDVTFNRGIFSLTTVPAGSKVGMVRITPWRPRLQRPPLADPRVSASVVEEEWPERGPNTFCLTCLTMVNRVAGTV